ncbi:MAG: hypothetical protein IPG53_16255 [Ignavibacteriales bacterium]|nr:hypothetical protein [Ignavibacteriales bacterium]
MKQYTSHPGFSTSMADDKQLEELIRKIIIEEKVTHVFESGTYLGTGSTRMIADAFADVGAPKKFITVEANYFNWVKAVKNLEKYPFVTPVWGLTLNREEAIEFVVNDEMLKNAHKYPDIYCDGGDDPHGFYTKEIKGEFGNSRFGLLNYMYNRKIKKEEKLHYQGENMIKNIFTEMKNNNPLILLDSSGGVGYLEFKTTLETLNGKPFIIILDDIHHVKHHRSYLDIKNSPDFTVVGENYEGGWLFAMRK